MYTWKSKKNTDVPWRASDPAYRDTYAVGKDKEEAKKNLMLVIGQIEFTDELVQMLD
jgi:hypothetical protein